MTGSESSARRQCRRAVGQHLQARPPEGRNARGAAPARKPGSGNRLFGLLPDVEMMLPRRLAKLAAQGCMVGLLFSCVMPDHDDTDSTPVCVTSEFLENGQYVRGNASHGIPFPFVRHSFCTSEDEAQVSYSFELSDARKVVHAVFTLEFSAFRKTAHGATARYEQSTFQAVSEFAVGMR